MLTRQAVRNFSCSSLVSIFGGWPARLVSDIGVPRKRGLRRPFEHSIWIAADHLEHNLGEVYGRGLYELPRAGMLAALCL